MLLINSTFNDLENQSFNSKFLEEGKVIQLSCSHTMQQLKSISAINAIKKDIVFKGKNISLTPNNSLSGIKDNSQYVKFMMISFRDYAKNLVAKLFPEYNEFITLGRTSYRPTEIVGRQTSIKKDDTRLHVDAFPSSPMGNKRILRVFANINNDNQSRVWRLGENFDEVLGKFWGKISKSNNDAKNLLMFLLGITKQKRTKYDNMMLSLHNAMKFDEKYQKNTVGNVVDFEPFTSWVVYTDLVSHAALQGSQALEQTFYINFEKNIDPKLSPQYKIFSALNSHSTKKKHSITKLLSI